MTRRRAAAAGAAAAVVWGLAEPLDRRLFRYGYSDIAILGQALTRGRGWRAAGFAVHAANGAAFGLGWRALRKRTSVSPVALALVEHLAFFPLALVVDRRHPARGSRELPPLFTWRAFAQATVRHVLFGWLLGRFAGANRG
jgi:hypothetical protein